MNWQYFNPEFEYEEKFQDVAWPWAGHKYFAYDLVANLKPKRIVELGTHYGTSFWSFSQAVKDLNLETELNAVDTWEGEKHAGFYGEEVFIAVNDIKDKYYSDLNIHLIRKTFNEAVSSFDDGSIDILHIDGLHTYEAVKNDFETWLPKVKSDGIILFHDIVVSRDDFGVYRLWEELKEKYQTMEFRFSYGLGILFKDGKSPLYGMKKELELRYSYFIEDIETEKIKHVLRKNNQELWQKDQLILQKDQALQQKDQELQQKDIEINFMKSSKFWKLRNRYLRLKSLIFPKS